MGWVIMAEYRLGLIMHYLPVESVFQKSYNFAGETGSKLNVR
jgi:hypothetical protein